MVARCAWTTRCGGIALLALACAAPPRAALAGDFIFADGFDIDLANAYFVSNDGSDANPGTRDLPFQTIAIGISAAALDPVRHTVAVAAGSYGEAFALVNGVNVFGHFQPVTWLRDPTTTSVINGSVASGIHRRTIVAANISSTTTLDGFVIYGAINGTIAGNSYAIYVSAANANLRISNNVIFAGRGGPGMAGAPGSDGSDGNDGAVYSSALDSFTATGTGLCNASNNRAASGGGVLTCPLSDDVGGGNGGGNNCTPALNTQNSTSLSVATAGLAGDGAGGGSKGDPGTRGYDAQFTGTTCLVPSNGGGLLPMFGGDGAPGGSGADAAGVGGCSLPAGTLVAGDWSGGSGLNGTSGANGGGGSAGGGAFAIFIVGGAAPVITGNLLFLGDGGDGGNGGSAGVGGLGGSGTQGGQTGALFCSGGGGRGGDGGNGGHGAGGGGGCGGVSVGIFTSGIGSPNYCTTANNTAVGGFAGSGGSGGLSLGNPGGPGQAGVSAVCSFH